MSRTQLPYVEPAGWQEKRSKWTWGIFFLSAAVLLATQWLSQIIGGALVGASVGIEGLASITDEEFASLNSASVWSFIVITIVLAGWCAAAASEGLTWHERRVIGEQWGMDWWRGFWKPVLIGFLVHGVIFIWVMWDIATN